MLFRSHEALCQLLEEPGLEPSWEGRLLAELDRFARTWVAADRDTWPEARAILGDLLAHRTAGSAHEITAIGHATSTRPGCGRSPRRAARSCARGRASSR